MLFILKQYLITFGWALTGAISMAISLGIMLKVFTWITPINEWEEIKNKNWGVVALLSVVVISTAIVIGITIMP
ncbi:DUF350 domain-containing protein [Patescibacteria group bacterium]